MKNYRISRFDSCLAVLGATLGALSRVFTNTLMAANIDCFCGLQNNNWLN
jgi:hypothetical protein